MIRSTGFSATEAPDIHPQLAALRLITAAALCLLILGGCAASPRTHSSTMSEYMLTELDFERGINSLAEKIYDDTGVIEDGAATIHLLELGAIYGATGRHEESNKALEEVFWRYVEKEDGPVISLRSTGQGILAFTVATGTGGYLPTSFERIYLHAMKANNYLLLNDLEGARVEVRRAYNLQRVLREDMDRRRDKAVDKDREKRKNDRSYSSTLNGLDTDSINRSLSPDPALQKKLAGISSQYENPYTMVLASLVYLISNEVDDARIEAMRAKKTVDSAQVARVANVLERLSAGIKGEPLPNVFVFAEVNSAPRKFSEDFRILNFNTGAILKISFPIYVPVERSVDRVRLEGEDLDPITDIELLAFKEYEDELPLVMIQTLTRAISHSLKDQYLEDQFGALGALMGTVSNELLEGADTRSWTMLPGQVLFGAVHTQSPDVTLEVVRAGAPYSQTLSIDPDRINIIHLVANARLNETFQISFKPPKDAGLN